MAKENFKENHTERRSETRKTASHLFGAEIKLPGVPIHRFKLKDISLNGACILIKEDSSMLNHIKAGQTLNMKYYYTHKTDPPAIKSEIKYITKPEEGRFKGHYLVGVFLSEKLNLT
jgi:hypothetical protein